MVTYGEELPPTKSNSPWLRRNMMSRDKLKTLNVLFHKIYYYQTWQSGTKGNSLSAIKSYDSFLTLPYEVTW